MNSALIWGVLLLLSQTVWADPAPTDAPIG
jgi:hypothetical protein